MSRYVEQVYINSGVNPDKIRYFPWILRIDAGYYLKDSDSGKLRDWLSNQLHTIQQVYFPYGTSDAAEEHHAFMVRTANTP